MDTAGEISVLIKFSPKRDNILENLKEQIKNSEQFIPNKIIKLSTTRWTVRTSALLRIIENYSCIMELSNECLVNENLTTEIKSRVIGCQSQVGKSDLTLGIVSIRIWTIFRNHCRAKKCLLPPVNDWKTSLSRCFNHLELKNLLDLFTKLLWEKWKNYHLFQSSESYPANIVHLIIQRRI